MTARHIIFLLPLAMSVCLEAAAPTTHESIDRAIAKGDVPDVKAHLANNPACANKGSSSLSPLEQAILRKKPEIATILIQAGADPNATNASKRSPLHLAVERNLPELIPVLLKAGAKPDQLDNDGWTPLHHAAAKNQLATATALIDGGANPMTLSARGGTPLHEAACSGGREIIELLLNHKVDPTIRSKDQVTALDIARQYNNQAAIDILSKL